METVEDISKRMVNMQPRLRHRNDIQLAKITNLHEYAELEKELKINKKLKEDYVSFIIFIKLIIFYHSLFANIYNICQTKAYCREN